MQKIGIFTSGGDAPGMNAAVRAVVKTALHYGISPVGILDGFDGMIEGKFQQLHYDDVDNIIQLGGTILGSARSAAFRTKEGRIRAARELEQSGIEGLIVVGGDGSFTGAQVLYEEHGVPFIGLPGTIDNDLYGTEASIGYDTALNTIVRAVDQIRDTATSHHRIFFVEVMGRNAGFLALNSAIASGAESVLIPESITNIEELAKEIKQQNKGKRSSIIIVAEGDDAGGAMDIVKKVRPYLEDFELRTTILGHTQRGGSPSYFDRALATRSGIFAVEQLQAGTTTLMIGIQADEMITVPISKAIEASNTPNLEKAALLKKLLTG
ncbi:MAG: 6-phosphofructokinase [Bacteroidota bacterium]